MGLYEKSSVAITGGPLNMISILKGICGYAYNKCRINATTPGQRHAVCRQYTTYLLRNYIS